MIRAMIRKCCLILYYGFATYLPDSYAPVVGKISNKIRVFLVKRIFKKCGKISTINRNAYFGNGAEIEMGDYSGIGANCVLPNNIKMGKYIMMAPNVRVLGGNHRFDRTDIPMCEQGVEEAKQTIIKDDCWIGVHAIITSGRVVSKGSIIAAGAVLTKDFPEYSIVGGNPARLIKSRK